MVAALVLKNADCRDEKSQDILLLTCENSLPNAKKISERFESASPPTYKQSVPMINNVSVITRVSDNTAFERENGRARHQYSRRSVWNIDETLMDIGGALIDAIDYSVIKKNIGISSERVWSNTQPDVMYGLRFIDKKNTEFVKYNVRAEKATRIFLFDEYDNCTIGNGEGVISNDDKKILFLCSVTADKKQQDLIAFDIEAQMILGKHVTTNRVDWAGFSQTGQYIVMDSSKRKGEPKYLTRFTPLLEEAEIIARERHHGDFGIDSEGNDVYVMIGSKYIEYLILKSGRKVRLGVSNTLNPVGHGHMSCRNLLRPGWCYISTYNNIIGAVKIAQNKRLLRIPALAQKSASGKSVVEVWGLHNSSLATYNAIPKASVSPSGTKVIFTSDWNETEEINDYVLSLLNNT